MDVGEIWFVSCLEVVEDEDNRILRNSDSARVVTALPAEGLLGPWTALVLHSCSSVDMCSHRNRSGGEENGMHPTRGHPPCSGCDRAHTLVRYA